MDDETIAQWKASELPPGIKEKIYSWDCSQRHYYNPSKPNCECLSHPFTRAYGQVRVEWLEHFYRTHTIYFNLSDDIIFVHSLIAWLNGISPEFLAPIRHFTIHVRACRCIDRRSMNTVEVQLKDGKYAVVSSRCFNNVGANVSQDIEDRLNNICEGLPVVDRTTGKPSQKMPKWGLEKIFQSVSRVFEGHIDPYCEDQRGDGTISFAEIWLRRWISNFDPLQEANLWTFYRKWRYEAE